jgi:hypothetical protein
MGFARQQQDRARQFAVALASLCHALRALPLPEIAGDPECLRLASEVLSLLNAGHPSRVACSKPGRRPRHDRHWAKSALLDHVTRHPDGMLHQAALVRELANRFEAAGLTLPGQTWLKRTVREFESEVSAFEMEAAATFCASPALQAAFESEVQFLAFRRAKRRIEDIWRKSPRLHSRYSTPSEFIESVMNADASSALEDDQFAPIRAETNQPRQCNDEDTTNEDFENGTQ